MGAPRSSFQGMSRRGAPVLIRSVSISPATTVSGVSSPTLRPPRLIPIVQRPAASFNTVTESLPACLRTSGVPWSAEGESPPEPGSRLDGAVEGAARSSAARARMLSRRARSCSAATVRRRISAYRTAYALVRRSTLSSRATSVFSESRISRNRFASIVTLSSSGVVAVGGLLAERSPSMRPVASPTLSSLRNATTSTPSPRMVVSSTTTTSPDRSQAVDSRSSPAATGRTTRGRK